MRKKKYLPLYFKWLKNGMPHEGLCDSLANDDNLWFVSPSVNEERILLKHNKSAMYWGSDDRSWREYEFTPLRQNILLLIAAMAGEL